MVAVAATGIRRSGSADTSRAAASSAKRQPPYTVLDADLCSAVDLGYLPDDERFDELNYPYARKLAAFVRSIFGETNVDSTGQGLRHAIEKLRLFAADGIGCDCNLYPVQRPNHGMGWGAKFGPEGSSIIGSPSGNPE